MTIPYLRLPSSDPRARGRAHGEHFKGAIRALYEIRLELTLGRTDLRGEAEVLQLAERHLPLARDFDAALFAELEGVSEGSGLGLAELVVLNHYTDLRDLSRAALDDGGCSVVYAPASGGVDAVLGQTWDMHGSATDYVCVLDVGEGEDRVALFSITGCLGMTGLNAHGLGMTINNLNSLDAKIGILWPTLVRRCLRERTAAAARALIEDAPLGSGHHYVVADGDALFGLETSGTKKKLTQSGGDRVHLHTNHCLDPEMADTARVLSTSTTHARLEKLEALVDEGLPAGAEALFAAFELVSNGRDPSGADPHKVATCGAFVMDLKGGRALACQGPPGPGVDPLILEVRN